MIVNPAFEFLRRHKEVKPDVETLVLKKIRGQINTESLLEVFENGIAGKYGKIYSLDAATLMSWIDTHKEQKNSVKNYLHTGLINANEPVTGSNYPSGLDSWLKEVNKCYNAFLNGVSAEYFHPHVYDRLMLDAKILFGTSMKFFDNKKENITEAKQKAVSEYFNGCKKRGWTQIYFIQ